MTNDKVEVEVKEFDIENLDDKKVLAEELRTNDFFKFEDGLTYKVELTSSKIKPIVKEFEQDDGTKKEITRYQVELKAKCSDNSEYKGVALLPKSVMSEIFKNYEKGAIFNIAKTGKGRDTKYNVTKDF